MLISSHSSEGDRYSATDNEGVVEILLAAGVYNDLQVGLNAQPFVYLCLIGDFERHFRSDADRTGVGRSLLSAGA